MGERGREGDRRKRGKGVGERGRDHSQTEWERPFTERKRKEEWHRQTDTRVEFSKSRVLGVGCRV